MTKVNLMLGDCLDRLKELDDNSVDSIVTDPPYGLSFMGKAWDKSVPSQDVWEECLRVLKPGGHLLAFAGTRTQHRMAVAIEDAGFEIRDMIAWVYGSGFPKSQNISKAIDKAAGVDREVVGYSKGRTESIHGGGQSTGRMDEITAPATDEAKEWDGWGTALKPALEPITVARKPLGEKTVAANVLKHGTGGLNIDDCRVGFSNNDDPRIGKGYAHHAKAGLEIGQHKDNSSGNKVSLHNTQGRFPANLIHDGSDEVLDLFPYTKSGRSNGNAKIGEVGDSIPFRRGDVTFRDDDGSAARFFYCAKTSKKDRNEGVDKNNHPTVKPTDLMRYLVRMVTPPNGTVLDPFMGSGSTGKAAKLEGFDFIGIELDPEYMEIAKARIEAVKVEASLEGFFE